MQDLTGSMRYLDGAIVAALRARIDPLEVVTEVFLAVRAVRSRDVAAGTLLPR